MRRAAGRRRRAPATRAGIEKAPTGIPGLDEITGGGLPRGRPTLVCGGTGCGKTLLAMEFLVRGVTEHGEPGVFMAFEETAEELEENVRSLGFRLDEMVAKKQLFLDHVRVERSEIEETGEYNLDGLFVRLAYAIDQVKAKRVVLDTLEALFLGFSPAIVRAELRRLFRWLKDRGVTAIVTGERGEGQLTRQGLEEYVSDCVILLDHRVSHELSTRRLRIVKYRGTAHGTNEYPFLIDEDGFSVLPVTALRLDQGVSNEVISTGIAALDVMFARGGLYRGSSILLSGTAGTGKTSVAASLIDAACRRGERCQLFAYEESEAQIVRNLRSIGIDLGRFVERGLLEIHAARPSSLGLEMHLVKLHKLVERFQPRLVVLDPINNFVEAGDPGDAHTMLVRMIDFLKTRGVTALYTSLTGVEGSQEKTDAGISSLIDTWLLLRQEEVNGERNRTLFLLKARGMSHSNQVREFVLTDRGIELRQAYLGPHGVLTGSARVIQEARDREDELRRREETAREQAVMASRRAALEAQIEALKVDLAAVTTGLDEVATRERRRVARRLEDEQAIAQSRRADGARPGEAEHG